MNDNIIDDIKAVFSDWSDRKRGSEKSDTQLFWIQLLQALGLQNLNQTVEIEKEVPVDNHTGFIDLFVKPTKVLIEQKSRGIDLDKPIKQSDGSFLTPFEQAKRYADALPYSQHPRWIVLCNFDEFRVYDMDRLFSTTSKGTVEPQIILFNHLTIDYKRLMFLVDPNDDNIEEVRLSKEAVDRIKFIRDVFARKILKPRRVKNDPVDYLSPDQKNTLNKFCVRLVFCLYAEDANIFAPNQFVDYISGAANYGRALIDLFNVLNTPEEQRPADLPPALNAFKYVNGNLFNQDAVELPPFDNNTADGITLKARKSESKPPFNWFTIDPTIFGALFESDLNADKRRAGGMHYTSRANIHKVIDPLFMEELGDTFDAIKRKPKKNRRLALEQFQNQIASMTFFDPACGSGNFLTETFISLRQLENKIIDELIALDAPASVKVSIDQFYGIEINDFACAIAQTAMWIAENKMLFDTDPAVRKHIQYLPLKHSARIVCANALSVDWHDIVPDGADFIIGNPPFSGARLMTASNKNDVAKIFDGWKNIGNFDLVACWFKKAADFMIDTETRAALVATNSICQGETVSALWRPLLDTIHIDFARRTFKWTSDTAEYNPAAAVHCVIVGFSTAPNDKPKIIIDGDKKTVAENINAYLLDAPNFFVERRPTPICDVPTIVFGSMANDGGNLIISADDYEDFIQKEPCAKKFIFRFVGGEEFLNNKIRYCLWLIDATDEEIQSMPLVAQRVEAVRRYRLSSKRAITRKLATTPALFAEIRQPTKNFILIPRVSSERRFYIPMNFVDSSIIASDRVMIIPNAGLFEFGILNSIVHMAWTRVVCGRFEMRYTYSATIVYNNFPWCGRSARIEETAQQILDARSLYPDWTLAALYDPNTMPVELRAAHEENDRAVLDAYGFSESMTELEIVCRLMEIYQRLTSTASADKMQ